LVEKKEGQLQKRITEEFEKAYKCCYSVLKPTNEAEMAGLIKTGLKPNIEKIVGEMRKDIRENTLPESKLINLGDYVLVEKNVLKKWLGEDEQ